MVMSELAQCARVPRVFRNGQRCAPLMSRIIRTKQLESRVLGTYDQRVHFDVCHLG